MFVTTNRSSGPGSGDGANSRLKLSYFLKLRKKCKKKKKNESVSYRNMSVNHLLIQNLPAVQSVVDVDY